MAVSTLRILLSTFVFLLLSAACGSACFGPKLFIGVVPGLEGEMRYHLVAIYLHEKTGIESTQVELKPGQSAMDAIAAKEIDLGFSSQDANVGTVVLRLDAGLNLYSGDRPLNDLQFSTVGRAFSRLQNRLDGEGLDQVRQAIDAGSLPASAVRDFMLRKGWI